MDAIKFFKAKAIQLPLCRKENENDFEKYLDGVYAGYLAEFENLESADHLTQQIRAGRPDAENLCEGIKKAVREYLHGFPHGAFDAMEEAIRRMGGQIDALRFGSTPAKQELYRIRAERPDEEPKGMWFTRKDLFHIPFEKRHLVTRQRYSIPGLPCLYFGSTLLVCWEELRRPPFHSLYVSRFSPRSEVTITLLDFSSPPAATAKFIERNIADLTPAFEHLVARAVCWPLLAACSIRRLHASSPFIAEYIVPQLLLQWVTRPDKHSGRRTDGIVYFSVNADPIPDWDQALLNFVFPAQHSQADGHCAALKAKFELTEPASWQILESSNVLGVPTKHASMSIPIVKDVHVHYQRSPFGIVEQVLNSFPLRPLDGPP